MYVVDYIATVRLYISSIIIKWCEREIDEERGDLMWVIPIHMHMVGKAPCTLFHLFRQFICHLILLLLIALQS